MAEFCRARHSGFEAIFLEAAVRGRRGCLRVSVRLEGSASGETANGRDSRSGSRCGSQADAALWSSPGLNLSHLARIVSGRLAGHDGFTESATLDGLQTTRMAGSGSDGYALRV